MRQHLVYKNVVEALQHETVIVTCEEDSVEGELTKLSQNLFAVTDIDGTTIEFQWHAVKSIAIVDRYITINISQAWNIL